MQQIFGELWSRPRPEYPAFNDGAARANNGRAINGVKALPGAASSHGTGLLLQLGSDFLEEPSCSIGEGSGADIARFGIAAEAPIFPKSDPIARIHSVFGIDQMLQGPPLPTSVRPPGPHRARSLRSSAGWPAAVRRHRP